MTDSGSSNLGPEHHISQALLLGKSLDKLLYKRLSASRVRVGSRDVALCVSLLRSLDSELSAARRHLRSDAIIARRDEMSKGLLVQSGVHELQVTSVAGARDVARIESVSTTLHEVGERLREFEQSGKLEDEPFHFYSVVTWAMERLRAQRELLRHPGRELEVGSEERFDLVCRSAKGMALRFIPPKHQARYSDEWTAELHDLPVTERKFYAMRLMWRSWALRRSLNFRAGNWREKQNPWGRV